MKTAEKLYFEMKYDNMAVLVRKKDTKGKMVLVDSIANPLQLVEPRFNCSPEQKREILQMLYTTKKCPDTEEVNFDSYEELNNYIARLKSQIDEYTVYIENMKQQEEAERHNKVIRSLIAFVEENEYMPERIYTDDFRFYYMSQAFEIINNVERKNERCVVLYAIDWIKRMGFQKVQDFPYSNEGDVVRYSKSVSSNDLSFDYEMAYEISKDDSGKYHVKFYYDFYDFAGKHCIDEASIYTPVFMRKGARMVDIKNKGYHYR
jgi:hypothetical protein